MSTPSSLNRMQAQLRQLKKAIRAEVHRKTGHNPPLLANNANFENAITFADLEPQNAWYIVPNAAATGNKITQLYTKNTLKKIIHHANTGQRKSPFTRIPITRGNIRKYMNFGAPRSTNVINLTSNGNPASTASTPRPRRGPLNVAALKTFMMTFPNQTKVKIMLTNATQTQTTHFFITKAGQTYVFYKTSPSHIANTSISISTEPIFVQTLTQFLAHYYPGYTRYQGYRRVY